ncbi:hypothetical protein ISS07_01415 [Candidatus Woesearchaeota archaeon]|nr:hypothetical protein [Candidatus Woesearchaeota archaeon]
MKKRGAIGLILTFAVLIVFVVVMFKGFFGNGLLSKAAEAGENLADTQLAEWNDNSGKDIPKVDEKVENFYNNLVAVLESKGTGPCIVKYEPLADFKDNEISMIRTKEGIFVSLENKDGQLARTKTIKHTETEKKEPCVVKGNEEVYFYDLYLKPRSATVCLEQDKSKCPKEYQITEISLKEDESIIIGEEDFDLEDQGLLFKATDGNVCFIPTKDGDLSCDADEGILDDDCLEDLEKQLNKGTSKLKYC